MSDVGDNNFIRYIYMGEDEDEIIPRDATHIIVHESVTVIRAHAFHHHPNIVEVICHENVEKIERYVFFRCPSLRRVIMPGVKIVETYSFCGCYLLTNVECGKLERIQEYAFCGCKSLKSINLSSARIVEEGAFGACRALTDAKFGSKLERIERAFLKCTSLERITIPFKDGLIHHDNTFQGCDKLKHVDLVEGELHETIAALHLEEWRNDMNKEIHSINQIPPTACVGHYDDEEDDVVEGEKAVAIRTWIKSLLGKIIDYKEEHRRLIDENVPPILKRFVPREVAMINVLPFLELPPYTFEVGDHT